MKISLNWLKEYVNTDLSAEKIAQILTDTGLEVEKVEEVESVPGGLKGIVVGEVLEKWPHPNADRLNLTKVNIGAEEPLQIVCGAKNVEAGQKVVVSTIGAMLYPVDGEPFKIKKGKIRGELSEGMICAEDEIGLGKSHDGILVLDNSASPGTEAAEYFNLTSDTSLEIGLTPNRTDAMGHFGVARDLVVALRHMEDIDNDVNAELKTPQLTNEISLGTCPIEVHVDDSQLCPRYSGVSITGVKIDDSPEWLKKRLRTLGIEPINNAVDITNYVMHEFGHPLHAFDQNEISGGKLMIKTLPFGTKFTTLDKKERELSDEDLMICDGDSNPLCLAGVFGGLNSGVSETTETIFIECAAFQPVSVRKSAKRHQLNTDASFRFERGVDQDMCIKVLSRAADLMVELCGGTVDGGVVDVFDNKIPEVEIDFSVSRCNALIGQDIPVEKIKSILTDLDFKVEEGAEIWKVKAPKYRVDVTREADLIEEVLRIYGYNSIPLPEKLNASLSYFHGKNEEKTRNDVANALSSRGYLEMMSNSLTKQGHEDICNKEVEGEAIKLLNPLSSDLGELRTGLTYNMLQAVSHNLNRRSSDLKLYEFGNVYSRGEKGYQEELLIGVVCTGKRFSESWNRDQELVDVTDVNGALEVIFNRLNINVVQEQKGGVLNIKYKNEPVAFSRKANKAEVEHFGISQDVYIGLVYWTRIMKRLKGNAIVYSKPSKFPSVRRDLSLLVNDEVSFQNIKNIALKQGGGLVNEVSLFDVYEGKKLPAGKKSYAINLVLSDANKTLNDKQIDKSMNRIIDQLKKELSAELR